MLALEHVAVRYSRRPVLRDVSFSVAPGEIVAYLGANGAACLASRVEAHSVAYALSLVLLLVVWRWLVRRREREALSGRLVFDDVAASPLTILDLDYRPDVPVESVRGCC